MPNFPRIMISGLFALLWICSFSQGSGYKNGGFYRSDPEFLGFIENVTVALGRDAVLSCTVTNLNNYKVGWIKAGDQTILTLHKRVITHNSRIHVTHDEHHTWSLHIKGVALEDRDCYMCQVNTAIMKKQVGCVNVLIPPDIMSEATSSDVTVAEGDNTTLSCRANGDPRPTITWRREDKELMRVQQHRVVMDVKEYSGANLQLFNIRRNQMGSFMCIASNNVPPAVSKRVTLNVNFPPAVSADSQLVGSPVGEEVTLRCYIEAFPEAIIYWQRKDPNTHQPKIIMTGSSFLVSQTRSGYKTLTELKIRKFSSSDAGTYECISTNSLGQHEAVTRLYVIERETAKATSTIPTTAKPTLTTTEKRGNLKPTIKMKKERRKYKNTVEKVLIYEGGYETQYEKSQQTPPSLLPGLSSHCQQKNKKIHQVVLLNVLLLATFTV